MDSNFWKELIKLLLISIVVVVPFRLYVAQPFIVEGASMDPTFESGNYLIVDEFSYHFKTPVRGEVIIFKYPKDPKKSFIKRVIGLPNEIVIISDGTVAIVNAEHPGGLVLSEPYIKLARSDNLVFKLETGEYFVLGDNRPASADSRVWGAVPEDNIIGRPIIRFFPPAVFPGDYSQVYKTSNE